MHKRNISKLLLTAAVLFSGIKPAAVLSQGAASASTGTSNRTVSKTNPQSKGPLAEPNSVSSPVTQTLTPAYRIGPGDVLQINVWKEPEASVPEVVVRSDGKISLPIVKEVEVLGLAPSELEGQLTERLSRFINEPEVTVLVKQINSEKIYVVGAVRKEGAIRLQSSMTVLQALAEAGGLTEYAKKKRIYVLRTQNQKQIRLPFNYEAVLKGDNTEQNFVVLPGDTIVVPQ